MRSDHLSVVAYNGPQKLAVNKTSTKTRYRKRSPAQHAQYVNYASIHDLGLAIQSDNVQLEFDRFYATMYL